MGFISDVVCEGARIHLTLVAMTTSWGCYHGYVIDGGKLCDIKKYDLKSVGRNKDEGTFSFTEKEKSRFVEYCKCALD